MNTSSTPTSTLLSTLASGRAPAALLLAALATTGCGVVDAAGSVVGAAVSVTGAVVSTGVTVGGKVAGAAVDAVKK